MTDERPGDIAGRIAVSLPAGHGQQVVPGGTRTGPGPIGPGPVGCRGTQCDQVPATISADSAPQCSTHRSSESALPGAVRMQAW